MKITYQPLAAFNMGGSRFCRRGFLEVRCRDLGVQPPDTRKVLIE